MEKLKDILHDFTDVILAIGIAILMFAVVVMNLGDWFNFNTIALADSSLPAVEEPIEEVIEELVEEELTEEVNEEVIVEEATEEETTEEKVVEETNNENNKPKVEEGTNKPVKNNETDNTPKENNNSTEVVSVVEVKKITIPNGSPGSRIAKILKENGLINDTADFIKTAEDLKLLLKLKPGTFNIPANATVEEIIRIIAR